MKKILTLTSLVIALVSLTFPAFAPPAPLRNYYGTNGTAVVDAHVAGIADTRAAAAVTASTNSFVKTNDNRPLHFSGSVSAPGFISSGSLVATTSVQGATFQGGGTTTELYPLSGPSPTHLTMDSLTGIITFVGILSGDGSSLIVAGSQVTGTVPRAHGGTGADTSAYGNGLLGSDGSNNTIDVDTMTKLELALGGVNIIDASELNTPAKLDGFGMLSLAGDQVVTGNKSFTGATMGTRWQRLITSLNGGTNLATGQDYFDTISTNRSFAITGNSTNGEQINLYLNVISNATVTFPASQPYAGTGATITTNRLWVGFHNIRFQRVNGLWMVVTPGVFENLAAAVNPTVNEDATKAYSYGSRILNIANKTLWFCVDPAPGAAVWTNITGQSLSGRPTNTFTVINALDYGLAVGIDNTPTLQAAINAASNISARVFIPSRGKGLGWNMPGTLHVPGGMILEGEHGASATERGTFLYANNSGLPMISVEGEGVVIRSIYFEDDSPSFGTIGIQARKQIQAQNCKIEDCGFFGLWKGIALDYSWGWDIMSCYGDHVGTGIWASNQVNAINVIGGRWSGTNGIQIKGPGGNYGWNIQSTFESCQHAIWITNWAYGIRIKGNYFEANTNGIYAGGDGGGEPLGGLTISDNVFLNNLGTTNIVLRDVANPVSIGNRFEGVAGMINYDIAASVSGWNDQNTYSVLGTNKVVAGVSRYVYDGTNVTLIGGLFIGSGSGRPTNTFTVINALDYGLAVGIDNTPTLQAAINAASNISARVFIPSRGKGLGWNMPGTLHVPGGMILEGEHGASATERGTFLYANNSGLPMISVEGEGVVIRGIYFEDDFPSLGTIGIQARKQIQAQNCKIVDCGFYGLWKGIALDYSWGWDIMSCYGDNLGTGIWASNQVNTVNIIGGRWSGTNGIQIKGPGGNYGWNIQTTFESCQRGIWITNWAYGIRIKGSYFEGNTNGIYAGGDGDGEPLGGLTISDNVFLNNLGTTNIVLRDVASPVSIGNRFEGVAGMINYDIAATVSGWNDQNTYSPLGTNKVVVGVSRYKYDGTNIFLVGGNISTSLNLYGTNAVGSFATAATNAVTATGWTNSYAGNATAYVTATAVSFQIKNRAQTILYTSPTLTATLQVALQPGWSVIAASGLTGTALPW